MKRYLSVLVFILFWGGMVEAQQSPQAAFDQANTLFSEGELSEAMEGYRAIEKTGAVSGALYLNMGITAVQLDSIGLAKYYFLKASEFNSTKEQSATALEYVNSQFSRQSAMLPKLPWDRAIEWLNDVPGASVVFIIGFLITLIGLILLYLGWLNKLDSKSIFSYIITLIIAGTIVAGLAFYADYVNQRYDSAVLISTSQRVLESPKPESTLISIAYEGYDLTIDHWKSDEYPGWLYVRLGNGQFGWTKTNGIKIL